MAEIDVSFYASARDVAGSSAITVDLPDGSCIGDLCSTLVERFGAAMALNLDHAAFLQGDTMTRDRTVPVGSAVDILPPFAGG